MGDRAASYDVFLSYNWRDRAAVEAVAQHLKGQGLRVFLDRWYLVPGRSWLQTLEKSLASCRAAVVFLGPDGMGRWQQREKEIALDRQSRDAEFGVIPVLLAGADPALGFLGLNTWVDLRDGGPDGLAILEAAVRGVPPGADLVERIAATRAAICPYRELRPFREEDAAFFCGREAFTETLVKAVRQRPLIAVVGASGSGKSSVVRAGLVPRLRKGDGAGVWEAAIMVPRDRPLHSLAAALMPLLEPELSETDRLAEVGKLAEHFRAGTVPLRDIVRRVLDKQPGTDRLLLVVDQWEELYTLSKDEAVRRRFIAELLDATAGEPLTAVLTLRGDFYGHAVSDRDLADRLQDALVNLGPMTREELRRSMEEPAGKVGLGFEAGLVERILDDVGSEPGSLPLLEFVLSQLWERRRGGELLHEAYEAMHGVQGAIATRAEDVFDKMTAAEREAIRRLAIQLVRPGEGTEDTRRRASMASLGQDAEQVVARLADARLLVTARDITTGAEVVEVAHEALIRNWNRLRGWIDQDREFLRTKDRVEDSAKHWNAESRDASLLLPRGRPLAEAQDILAQRRSDLAPDIIEFIEASLAAKRAQDEEEARREGERQQMEAAADASRERERAARRLTRRTVFAAIGVGVLAVLAGGLAWYATRQANEAEAQRILAEDERNRALVFQSLYLASLSQQETVRGNATNGILLALEALPSEAQAERPYVVEAEAALYAAVFAHRELAVLEGHEGPVRSTAFSRDGRQIATTSADGTVRVWDVANRHEIVALRGVQGPIFNSATFSADGRHVLTASSDGTARLWDAATGVELAVVGRHELGIWSAAFSADGGRVVTASQDHTAQLWQAASGQELKVLQGHEQDVRSAAFSRDGNLVVTASSDGTARLWDSVSGQQLAILVGHEGWVLSAAFNADGTRVVTASQDGTARLWNAATGEALVILRGHEGVVWSAAFSGDGNRVVTASEDGTARLWDSASGKQLAILGGHDGPVRSAALTEDGESLVTASDDGSVRLWDARPDRHAVPLSPEAVTAGYYGTVRFGAFSRDGSRLLTASSDCVAQLWDAATGKEIATLGEEEDQLDRMICRHALRTVAAAFNPDGTRVATALGSRLRVWDAGDGSKLLDFEEPEESFQSVAFDADGTRLLVVAAGRKPQIRDAESGRVLLVPGGADAENLAAAFSADGRFVVAISWEGLAQVWDVGTESKLFDLPEVKGHSTSVALSPDGKRFFDVSHKDTAQLWDTSADKPKTLLEIAEPQGGIKSVAFSPDGSQLVVVSGEGHDLLWNADTGELFAALNPPEVVTTHAAFSRDGRRLLTAAKDGTTRVWDAATATEIAALFREESEVQFATFDADGGRVFTASWGGDARIWRIFPTTEALIEHAKGIVPRQLTSEEAKRYFIDVGESAPAE